MVDSKTRKRSRKKKLFWLTCKIQPIKVGPIDKVKVSQDTWRKDELITSDIEGLRREAKLAVGNFDPKLRDTQNRKLTVSSNYTNRSRKS